MHLPSQCSWDYDNKWCIFWEPGISIASVGSSCRCHIRAVNSSNSLNCCTVRAGVENRFSPWRRAGPRQLPWLCVSCRSYLWSLVELCLSSDSERAMSVKSGPGQGSGGRGGGSFVGPVQCQCLPSRGSQCTGHREPQPRRGVNTKPWSPNLSSPFLDSIKTIIVVTESACLEEADLK